MAAGSGAGVVQWFRDTTLALAVSGYDIAVSVAFDDVAHGSSGQQSLFTQSNVSIAADLLRLRLRFGDDASSITRGLVEQSVGLFADFSNPLNCLHPVVGSCVSCLLQQVLRFL